VARVLTVLAHGDADGVSSAAVVKAALAGEYETVRVPSAATPASAPSPSWRRAPAAPRVGNHSHCTV
jgi:single-stranded DNA-specific DHH superfamily exonuclease